MANDYLPLPGVPVEEIDTPALIVDLEAAEANIEKMQAFVSAHGTAVRPHSKTHKSPYWGHKQLAAGALGITCSKVSEAEALVDGGITEVLIANEIVGRVKIARLAALNRRANVVVAVDDASNVRDLSEAAEAARVVIPVIVDVNIRLNRCGVEPGEPSTTLARIVASSRGLRLEGLMGYEGHVTAGPDEKRKIVGEAMAKLRIAYDELRAAGLPTRIMTAGGTSTYNVTGAVDFVTDIQAGSYIFMDGAYLKEMDDFRPALTVMSTVISRPTPERAVLDIGKKSMSLEAGLPLVVDRPGATLTRLNEEHGVLQLEGEARRLRIGDRIRLLPMNCGTTINIHDYYFCVRNGLLEDVVPVAGRGRMW
jgi:D-serine deaminase-like pyridoxal phosphate-dependent protein